MRVYVPTTLDGLQRWYDDDVLRAPVAAWAVTDTLRDELGDVGDEEAEYAVSTAAAEASLHLLVDERRKRGRRVVVVTELSYSVVQPDDESPGAVTVMAPIEGSRIDAVLADSDDVPLTGSGESGDLAWFATQEIVQLLASTPAGQ
jgi:hypothetical protein